MLYNGSKTSDIIGLLASQMPSDILSEITDAREAGHVFEALCFGLIATGCTRYGAVQMLDGTTNIRGRLVPYRCPAEALARLVKQGGRSGYSDVSFVWQDTLCLTTCKWIREDSGIEAYEVGQLRLAATENLLAKGYDNGARYIVCCRNRASFLAKLRASRTKKDLLGVEEEDVLDIGDLDAAALRLRELLSRFGGSLSELVAASDKREPMALRFHQRLVVWRTLRMQEEDAQAAKQSIIIWAIKCRGGKTYTAAGHVAARLRMHPAASFLFITPVPCETIADIAQTFERHTEFAKVRIVRLDANTADGALVAGQAHIILASKQFLQNKDIPALRALDIDTVYFDEAHMGGSTTISRGMLSMYAGRNLVFLTATYRRPEAHWGVQEDRRILWDLEDERLCKEEDLDGLSARHGADAVRAVELQSGEDLAGTYRQYPRMKILSHFLRPDALCEIWPEGRPKVHGGLNMADLFAIGGEGQLMHPGEVDMLLGHIFGPQDRCVMDRLRGLAKGTRTEGFHTQIWFLPCATRAGPIAGVCQALKTHMMRHRMAGRFHTTCLYSDMENKPADVRRHIRSHEEIARQDGKRGVIVLTGNMASTGITLDLADVVFMMGTESSADLYFQKINRCMTEASEKPYGYVVDFNASRVIRSVLEYASCSAIAGGGGGALGRIRELGRVIDFEDALDMRPMDELYEAMEALWVRDYAQQYDYMRGLFAGMRWDQLLSKQDVELWGRCIAYSEAGTGTIAGTDARTLVVNEEDEQCEPGIAKGTTARADAPQKKEDPQALMRFLQEAAPDIVQLGAIMTTDDPGVDIIEILKRIRDDKGLARVFAEQVRCWWGDAVHRPDDVLPLCIALFTTYRKSLVEIADGISLIKHTYRSMLRDKKALLEYLNTLLKPKEAEKKRFGEVFTPFWLIDEMLDKLPPAVWSDPRLRWFDPAAGSGNFMVAVYYRLMEGLAGAIPDEDEREAHIIDNMMYMSELNAKNVMICRRVFGDRANIHEGDTLCFNPYGEEFGVRRFDVIMGNPPYQRPTLSGRANGGKALWPDFVRYAMKHLADGGYLVFVHPAQWRRPGDALHDLMFEHKMLVLNIQNKQTGQKTFGATTRYDWYVLQNTPSGPETVCGIRFEDGTTHDVPWNTGTPCIPNREWPLWQRCFSLVQEHGHMHVQCDSANHSTRAHVSRKQDATFQYAQLNGIHKDKDGIEKQVLYYSSKKHPVQDQKKVVFTDAEIVRPFYDDGLMGLTQQGLYILVANRTEGVRIVEYLRHPLVQRLFASTKWSNFRTEKSLFKMIPPPPPEGVSIEEYLA